MNTPKTNITKETPSLDEKTLPKAIREIEVKRDGENFILTVNGFTTILSKDQATYIGSRLMSYLTQFAQELGLPPSLSEPVPETLNNNISNNYGYDDG